MTTHGRSGLGRLLFGSVAEEVLRQFGYPGIPHALHRGRGGPAHDQGGRRMIATEPLSIEAIRERLRATVVGRHLYLFGEVESTNAVLRDLARSGAAEGTVVLAEAQRRGRGRLGQEWFSPRWREPLCLGAVPRAACASGGWARSRSSPGWRWPMPSRGWACTRPSSGPTTSSWTAGRWAARWPSARSATRRWTSWCSASG